MTVDEVDAYLTGLEEPKQSTLAALRRSIRTVVPDAEECISYGMPAFRVDGKVVAGFAAFKNHLAYLPHSGEVLARLGARLDGYEHTSGSLHFPIDEPLPDVLVRSLVDAKVRDPRTLSDGAVLSHGRPTTAWKPCALATGRKDRPRELR